MVSYKLICLCTAYSAFAQDSFGQEVCVTCATMHNMLICVCCVVFSTMASHHQGRGFDYLSLHVLAKPCIPPNAQSPGIDSRPS